MQTLHHSRRGTPNGAPSEESVLRGKRVSTASSPEISARGSPEIAD